MVVLPGQVFSMAWYPVRHLNPPEQAGHLIDVIQPPPVHLVSGIQAEVLQLVEVGPRMAGTQAPLWVTFLRPQLPEPIPNVEDREDLDLAFCHLPPEESTHNEDRRTEICPTEIPRFQVKSVDLQVLDSCHLPQPEDRTRNVVDPPEVRTLPEPPSSQVKPEALLPGAFLPGTFRPGTFLPGTFLPGTFLPGTFRRPPRRTPLLDVSAAQACP